MTNKKYYWFAMTLEQLLFGFRVSFECKNKQQNSYFEIRQLFLLWLFCGQYRVTLY